MLDDVFTKRPDWDAVKMFSKPKIWQYLLAKVTRWLYSCAHLASVTPIVQFWFIYWKSAYLQCIQAYCSDRTHNRQKLTANVMLATSSKCIVQFWCWSPILTVVSLHGGHVSTLLAASLPTVQDLVISNDREMWFIWHIQSWNGLPTLNFTSNNA